MENHSRSAEIDAFNEKIRTAILWIYLCPEEDLLGDVEM